MTKAAVLASADNQLLVNQMFRNKVINGGFDVWQRGSSQTVSGYGSDDRWLNQNVGSTKTHSQQQFALGQSDVSGNPKYFSRTVVTSVAGAGNYCCKEQRIESAYTLAGKRARLTFWAKADANKQIAIELTQNFGTGGSPSAGVVGIGAQLISLTTAWQKFSISIDMPSAAGKTLGNADGFIGLVFWFDAGTSFASRNGGLGQQSGTFDLAQVQLEEGEIGSPFEARPFSTELALCQRFYERLICHLACYGAAGTFIANSFAYKVSKRAAGTITLTDTQYVNIGAVAINPNIDCVRLTANAVAASGVQIYAIAACDAEL